MQAGCSPQWIRIKNVQIGWARKNSPASNVIYCATDLLWWYGKNSGCFKLCQNKAWVLLCYLQIDSFIFRGCKQNRHSQFKRETDILEVGCRWAVAGRLNLSAWCFFHSKTEEEIETVINIIIQNKGIDWKEKSNVSVLVSKRVHSAKRRSEQAIYILQCKVCNIS